MLESDRERQRKRGSKRSRELAVSIEKLFEREVELHGRKDILERRVRRKWLDQGKLTPETDNLQLLS